MTRGRFGIVLGALLGIGGAPLPAFAQTASEKAAAETLFQEAVSLMEHEQLAEACGKYQASYDLDPALGTLLRLADCYDRSGRSASAWALFVEAEVMAARGEQPERAQIAATRAADLKQRLSTMTLVVDSAAQVEGLSIMVDKAAVPSASWGTALPFDPGTVRVQANAPGYESWSTDVALAEGPAERKLEIPQLKPAPRSAAEPSVVTVATPRSASPEAEPQGQQATLGYVVGGVGLAGLAAAGVLAYRAYDLNQESLAQCAQDDPNACTSAGKDLRDDASRYGSWATVAGGIGAGLALTGLVLVLTADPEPEQARASKRWSIAADASPSRAELTFGGTW